MPIDELKNEHNEVVETVPEQNTVSELGNHVAEDTKDVMMGNAEIQYESDEAKIDNTTSNDSANTNINDDSVTADIECEGQSEKEEVAEGVNEVVDNMDGCCANETPAVDNKRCDGKKVTEKDVVKANAENVRVKPLLTEFEKKKRITKTISRVISITVWILGFALLYLCFSNLYQQMFNPNGYTGFFGVGNAVVASNSMNPEIYKNDLIFYKEIDGNEACEGDIIVYHKTNQNNEDMLVVHQVINIGNGYVTTQGLANAVPDESFPVSSVIGKYIFKIGKIGFLLNMLSTDWAPLVIILIMVVIVAVRVAIYFIHKRNIVAKMSDDKKTRDAINHFFDI